MEHILRRFNGASATITMVDASGSPAPCNQYLYIVREEYKENGNEVLRGYRGRSSRDQAFRDFKAAVATQLELDTFSLTR